MELIRGVHNLRPRHRGCVLTIGNFDGVHTGHKAVLERLHGLGSRFKLPSVVMIFEPQPPEFLEHVPPAARLTSFREKLYALERTSVDRVFCVRFDQRFASLAPNEFVERLLVSGLGAEHVVVGDDFRFGRGGEGNFETLVAAGRHYGFELHRRDTYRMDDHRVSSSRIREALAAGDFDGAAALLGRRYSILGRVVEGRRLGRTIGFPTANIPLRRRVSPISGVFVVNVRGAGEGGARGVANVGIRPTVDGETRLLEVHLLDFSQEIYGRHLEVEFLAKVRDERCFPALDELKAQIREDTETARRFFATGGAGSVASPTEP